LVIIVPSETVAEVGLHIFVLEEEDKFDLSLETIFNGSLLLFSTEGVDRTGDIAFFW
jgi:hypothetical protein